jgi:hypothetical protein
MSITATHLEQKFKGFGNLCQLTLLDYDTKHDGLTKDKLIELAKEFELEVLIFYSL